MEKICERTFSSARKKQKTLRKHCFDKLEGLAYLLRDELSLEPKPKQKQKRHSADDSCLWSNRSLADISEITQSKKILRFATPIKPKQPIQAKQQRRPSDHKVREVSCRPARRKLLNSLESSSNKQASSRLALSHASLVSESAEASSLISPGVGEVSVDKGQKVLTPFKRLIAKL